MKPWLKTNARDSLSHKVFSAEVVRQHEGEAAQNSRCSLYDLMERAGQSVFQTIGDHWPDAQRVLVVCGHGNNGGDGYVAARLARQAGLQVTLCSLDPERELSGDAQTARQRWLDVGGKITDAEALNLNAFDLVIDALLGTGLSGDVKAPAAAIIARINQSDAAVLSVDIPSGLHADTGKVLGDAVQADVTVTFVGIKSGLTTGTGKQHCGHLEFSDLEVGAAFAAIADPRASLIGFADFQPLPKRNVNAHKGHFGRLLCIGGNRGMSGAIRLSAEAALRCGAGLVKVYCHSSSLGAVCQGRPELMVTADNLSEQLAWADAILLGPGLGQDSWSRTTFNEVLSYLVHNDLPVVIDADGLNLLSHHLYKLRLQHLVITPHPAEAARLLGVDTETVEADRFTHVSALAEKFSGACVLKGAGSLVCCGENTYICADGNPGMATAGMGDVLTGVVGAMLAQKLSAPDAALYGTCLHASAGDDAAADGGQRGLLASDLFPSLRAKLN